VILTAYFDESGIHDGDHLCVVAGFAGNDAQWAAFIADWILAIRPRHNLHMVGLRWKHRARIASLLARLGPIPHKYNLTPIAVSLSRKDYLASGLATISRRFTDPYVICATCCINVALAEFAKKDDMYFLFDRQKGLRKEAMEAIRNFSFEYCGIDSRFKGADFMNRVGTVCLDPADYLAYILRERESAPNSFKSLAGASIIGNKGHGGRIQLDQLMAMAQWWKNPPTVAEALIDLSKNPYFRGPK
jgi:hypothetical protein